MSTQSLWRALLFSVMLACSTSIARAEPAGPPLPESKWRHWQTGALRPDRLQHASLSMSAAIAIGLVSEDAVAGFAGGAALGIGKEIIDMRDTRFDWGDLTADLLGAGVGAFVAAALLP